GHHDDQPAGEDRHADEDQEDLLDEPAEDVLHDERHWGGAARHGRDRVDRVDQGDEERHPDHAGQHHGPDHRPRDRLVRLERLLGEVARGFEPDDRVGAEQGGQHERAQPVVIPGRRDDSRGAQVGPVPEAADGGDDDQQHGEPDDADHLGGHGGGVYPGGGAGGGGGRRG